MLFADQNVKPLQPLQFIRAGLIDFNKPHSHVSSGRSEPGVSPSEPSNASQLSMSIVSIRTVDSAAGARRVIPIATSFHGIANNRYGVVRNCFTK